MCWGVRLARAAIMFMMGSRWWGLGLLAWCAGVALQLQQAALWSAWAYAGMAALALCGGLLLRRRVVPVWCRAMAVCGIWAALSLAVTGLHALTRSAAIDPALEGQDLDVVGVVQAMPQRQDLGWRFRFQIEQAWQTDKSGAARALPVSIAGPSQVYLGWYGQDGTQGSGWNTSPLPEPVKAGERWRLRVRLKAPHGHMNPRGFDYELWLWEQGIRATGYVRTSAKDPAPVRLASTWAHPVEAWRQSVRDRLLTRLSPLGGVTYAFADPGLDAQAHKLSAQRTGPSLTPALGSTSDPSLGPSSGSSPDRLVGVVAALVVGDQAAIDRWRLTNKS